MSMLPSPIIEGTLPAFYLEKGMATITIPFSMSRAVNRNEVSGFKLKIKNLQGSTYLKTLQTSIDDDSINYTDSYINFTMTESEVQEIFSLGTFYKAQLAYIDNTGTTGYYSTVGIIKYTSKPLITISNLSTSQNNTHNYLYVGSYSQKDMDVTEKEYAYRFVIKNSQEEIIEDTGYLIHNSSNDTDYYCSQDEFTYNYDLISNVKYTITYSVKTNNGLEITGPSYKIIQKETLPITSISTITPSLNYENGYIELFFNKDVANEEITNGTFVLSRASEDESFENWETIVEFNLFSQKPSTQTWKDFTIEQGKKYQYSIQQYSKVNRLYSARIKSNIIFADFEDAFLYDGKRQLKIKFNPKVTSFKKNIFEAKVDTLGSKYPFIFRNGNVEYREFPISGLISYLSDEQSLFGNSGEQFEFSDRNNVYIYKEFNWAENPNNVIQDTLRRNQYKTNYMFFYVWDSNQSKYIKWIDDLKNQYENVYFKEPWTEVLEDGSKINHPGVKLINTKFFDPSDYDAYFDSTKIYLTQQVQKNKDLDVDNLKLKTTNLISYNISLERDFKMEVLNWLTNGEPKLFRSPSEGNFIIRLMNVSLSPEEKTGRMLHTFSSTAYEIADFTYSNLKNFNFINTNNFKSKYLKIQSIPLVTDNEIEVKLSSINYEKYGKYWYAKDSLLPPSTTIEFMEIDAYPNLIFNINDEPILLGGSGNYNTKIPVTKLSIVENWYRNLLEEFEESDILQNIPHITIGYFTDLDDSFSIVENVELKDICGRQFIGEHSNIKELLENFETQLISYQNINLYKRTIVLADGFTENDEPALYDKDGILIPYNKNSQAIDLFKYFKDSDDEWGNLYQQIFISNHLNSQDLADLKLYASQGLLFKLVDGEFIQETNPNLSGTYYLKQKIGYIYDAYTPEKKYLTPESQSLFEKQWRILGRGEFADYTMPYTYKYISGKEKNNDSASLEYTLWTSIKGPDKDFKSLQISAGLICDITYQVQITKYDMSKNLTLIDADTGLKTYLDKMSYLLSQEGMLETLIQINPNDYINQLNDIYYSDEIGKGYQATYEKYLEALKSHVENLQKYN